MEKERRSFPITNFRARGGEKTTTIEGHAAVFNELSDDLGGFKEMIRPGAFAQSIKDGDVRALINHDANLVLGRTKAGTLSLREDSTGLAIENTLPDTSYARDLMKSMERGDIDQMSFGFRALRDDWRMDGGLIIRELIEVELFDVSPVTFPSYPQTDIGLRSQFNEKIAALRSSIPLNGEIKAAVLARRARLDAIY